MRQAEQAKVGIGIDLGMTYFGAAVSYYSDGDSRLQFEAIESSERGSEYRTPTKLFYPAGSKTPIIGFQALSRFLDGAIGRYVELVKRLFGRSTKREDNQRLVSDTAELIRFLERDIARFLSISRLHNRQKRYAFSHPGSWGHVEKRDLLKAISAAGISSAELIEEPVAAALAAAFTPKLAHDLRGQRVVLVCDIGGGTTDLSLVAFDADGAIRMLGGTHGNPELGMSNLDQLIGLMIYHKTRGITDPDINKPLAYADVAGRRLQSAWDKLRLTPAEKTALLYRTEQIKRAIFDEITHGYTSGWPNVWDEKQYNITIQDINPILESLKRELQALIANYLKRVAGYDGDQIDLILVTGGGANIPTINEEGFFGKVLPHAKTLVAGRESRLLVQLGTAIHANNPDLVRARIPNASYGIQRQTGYETFIEAGVPLSKTPVVREERISGLLVNQVRLVVFEQFPGLEPRRIYEGNHYLPFGALDGKYKIRFSLASDGLAHVEIQNSLTGNWSLMKRIELDTNR